MKSKNELFMDAIEFLIDNGLAENQGDIAESWTWPKSYIED